MHKYKFVRVSFRVKTQKCQERVYVCVSVELIYWFLFAFFLSLLTLYAHTANSFTVVISFLQSNECVNKYQEIVRKLLCVYLECRRMRNNVV